MRLVRRWLEPRLVAALADTPVVFLTGARQTGKSTLAHALVRRSRGRRYVTFDDLATLASARADPDGFVRALTGPAAANAETSRCQASVTYRALALFTTDGIHQRLARRLDVRNHAAAAEAQVDEASQVDHVGKRLVPRNPELNGGGTLTTPCCS